MKFKLDENLGDIGRDLLEAEGYDVMTVAQQQMSGTDDQRIYDVCLAEARVLATLDHDFGHTLRFPPEATAGIAILECRGPQSPRAIKARIAELIAVLRSNSIEGQLWIVEPGRVRIRQHGPS